MKRMPFESLLEAFARPGEDAKTIAKNIAHPWSEHRLLSLWKKLPRKRKTALIEDYLRRHPPPKSAAEVHEELCQRAPLYRCFMSDSFGPAWYDAVPGRYALKDIGEWVATNPTHRRVRLEQPLADVNGLANELITLAYKLGCAFSVKTGALDGLNLRYSVVFLPVGDRRCAGFADKPEHAYELPGLPFGTALLFCPDEEGLCGLINESSKGVGCMVWSSFYAIQIVDYRFTEMA